MLTASITPGASAKTFVVLSCSFTSENGQIILGQPVNGFRPIGSADLGSTISYLCKNKNSYDYNYC
jgi:hypothetical protein